MVLLIDSNTKESFGTNSPGKKMQLLSRKLLGIAAGAVVGFPLAETWPLAEFPWVSTTHMEEE